MANKIVLADTSILIDYFRKTDKSNSGATPAQLPFWEEILKTTKVLSFDKSVARVAVNTNNKLKRKRKQIDLADLFIAATAIANNLPFATLNRNHFERIEELELIE